MSSHKSLATAATLTLSSFGRVDCSLSTAASSLLSEPFCAAAGAGVPLALGVARLRAGDLAAGVVLAERAGDLERARAGDLVEAALDAEATLCARVRGLNVQCSQVAVLSARSVQLRIHRAGNTDATRV